MIKNTIKTLALFVALVFAQSAVLPAVYAEDSISKTQQVQKNIEKEKAQKEKAQKEKEKEKARKEREREKARKERARLAAKNLKPASTPVIKPIAPAPVIPVPVVKPVVPAPVAPAPVTPAPVTPAPVTPAPVTPAPVVKPVVPTPVAPAPAPTTPALDGAALYTQNCAGCHGSSKRGKSVTATQSAIVKNVGGMGYLSSLSAAQLTAISQY